MANITAGNELYLYQLLRRELGVRRQANITRVEEVLAADGISPEVMGFDDVRALLEALPRVVEVVTFRKGNTYAIVRPNPAWDELLDRLADAEGKASPAPQTSARSAWKAKARGKGLRPVKPVARRRRAKAAKGAAAAAQGVDRDQADAGASQAEVVERPVDDHPAAATPTPAPAPMAAPAPTDGEAAQAGAEAQAGAGTQADAKTHVAAEAPTTPAETPEAPAADKTAAPDPASEPKGETLPAHAASVTTTRAVDPQRGLPQDFAREVFIKGGALLILNQILPLGVDITRVLDEDWRAARGAGAYEGDRGEATVPLRYLRPDGETPIRVTIRRTIGTPRGAAWALTKVDGDDGSLGAHETGGIEGADLLHGGAWLSLLPAGQRARAASTSPLRELAQFAIFGSLDEDLRQLADIVAPERWDLPVGGATGPDGRRVTLLREYLADTLHHVLAQGALAVSADGSFAAFDTNLQTPSRDDVFACFEQRAGDIPWAFSGFTTATAGLTGEVDRLGATLLARLGTPPAPVPYVSSLADVSLPAGVRVTLDADLASRLGPQAQVALARTVRRARASYRVVTPAYDPHGDCLVLLAPLALDDDGRDDAALVLRHAQDDALVGDAVAPLPAAYACARVVSAELPAWLAAGMAGTTGDAEGDHRRA